MIIEISVGVSTVVSSAVWLSCFPPHAILKRKNHCQVSTQGKLSSFRSEKRGTKETEIVLNYYMILVVCDLYLVDQELWSILRRKFCLNYKTVYASNVLNSFPSDFFL